MKIKKTLLPVALGMMLLSPAFADNTGLVTGNNITDPVQSVLSFDVPTYYDITVDQTSIAKVATVDLTGTPTLTLAANFEPEFTITTNDPDSNLTTALTAKCLTSSSTVNALYPTSTGTGMVIVFTNNDAPPASSSVTDITDDGAAVAASGNPNAIAFSITGAPALQTGTGTKAAEISSAENGILLYSIGNGVYKAKYTVGATVLTNSFNTMDGPGTYKATLIMSKAGV